MRFFTFIFLLFWALNAYSIDTNIDSLKRYIEYQNSSEEKLDNLLHLTDELIEIGNKKSLIYAEKSYILAEELNLEKKKALALKYKGIVWRIWGDNSKSATFLFSAMDIFARLNERKEYADCLRNIGETYRAFTELNKSLEFLREAEIEFTKLGNEVGLGETYNRIAAVYYEKLTSSETFTDNYKINSPRVNSFELFLEMNPDLAAVYDSTLKYTNLAREIALKYDEYDLLVSTDIILAAMMNFSGQRDNSFEIYERTIDLIKKRRMVLSESLVYYNYANLFLFEEKYDSALYYANLGYEIALENDYKVYIFLTLERISLIYQKMGDYRNALEYSERSKSARLTYFRNDIDAALKSQQYLNEAEAKTKEIEFTKKKEQIIIISFIVILSISVITILVISRKNKTVSKLNQSLQSKNEIISEKNSELNLLNAQKDKFFSIIAHDLKNPIGSFKNSTEVLLNFYNEMEESEKLEMIEMLKASSENINELLENLLDWSRSQSGKIPFNPVETELCKLVGLTLNLLEPLAKEKQIVFINEVPQNCIANIDPTLITTVIRNLVGNAIKFTKPGGKIILGMQEYFEEGRSAMFIKDTGIGIPDEAKAKLFKIDENVTTLGTSGEKGTGLGLILCKEFIEKHNGKIWVESQPNLGTTFYFTLPKNSFM